ncbi:hypothetical protein FAM09_14320 [Niastella caeni]|uniref:Uncharacterized protein n=1 Tax=Niastella caeni TaxID=2569763 RepID=A0A4S8HVG5_9BACT|nr:hypothetical protein [Niastella caeni]THU39668.1 hypothetical protein FAM09_14320 [Niastella caeni]
MQTLSPRKYVQMKARTLPVSKCMVNKDWEESQIANVSVMRKHSNGNVTIGLYRVDLLCLGVKDTVFFFNTSENEFFSEYSLELAEFKEIDYALAHNIIYAGHDFALEFDIHPHHNFEVTRFILEEDDHAIPVIEVPVGTDGLPHLIVEKPGQFADILAKLKQYAGEGNYYYTIEDPDVPPRLRDDVQTSELLMDTIPAGEVSLSNVQSIRSDDMLNTEKVQQRSVMEQITIHAELLTRLLPPEINTCTPAEELVWHEMWDEIGHGAPTPNNVLEEHVEEHVEVTRLTDDLAEILDRSNEQLMHQFETKMIELANKYAHNPLALQTIYEQGILLDLEAVCTVARHHALKMYKYFPVLHFSLALGALIQQAPDDRFENLYAYQDIREAVPGYEQYHASEVINFWLIRLWICLEQKDIKRSVQYYFMLVDGKATGWLLLPVLEKYVEVLYRYNKALKDLEQGRKARI